MGVCDSFEAAMQKAKILWANRHTV
jgi:hypothetical protein